LLTQQPPEAQAAIKEHEQDGKWPVYRTAEYTLYPYNQEPEPTVDCAPLRTTDVQLQPGETITDVALRDTERRMATPAASGDPRNAVPHLAVKPQFPGIETLTIYTTKHIYHLLLRSRGRAMQEVEFYYPDELIAAMKDADSAALNAKQEAVDPPGDSNDVVKVAAVDPAQINFAYTPQDQTFRGSRFEPSMTVLTLMSRCLPESSRAKLPRCSLMLAAEPRW